MAPPLNIPSSTDSEAAASILKNQLNFWGLAVQQHLQRFDPDAFEAQVSGGQRFVMAQIQSGEFLDDLRSAFQCGFRDLITQIKSSCCWQSRELTQTVFESLLDALELHQEMVMLDKHFGGSLFPTLTTSNNHEVSDAIEVLVGSIKWMRSLEIPQCVRF